MPKLVLQTFCLAIVLFLKTTGLQAQCSPDVTPPVLVAPADVTISSTAFDALGIQFNDDAQLETAFGAANATDNCGIQFLQSSNQSVVWPNGAPKVITRNFLAYDTALNPSNIGTQTITIEPAYTFHVPAWFYPGDALEDSLAVDQGSSALIGISYTDQVYGNNCDNDPSRRDRDWTSINWNTYNPATSQVLVFPVLDLDNDGQTGDAYDVLVDGDSVFRLENGAPVQYLGFNDGIYTYEQNFRYNYYDQSLIVAGTVFLDTTANCTFDNVEPTLAGWKVKVVGQNTQEAWTGFTTALGSYSIEVCPLDTIVELSLDVPFNYGQGCPMVYTLNMPSDTFAYQNIPVTLTNDCELLHVDLAINRLRPCFTNNQYSVYYANYSEQTIEDTYIQVTLDPALDYTSSSIPGTLVSGTTYNFETGDLAPGQGGNFTIQIFLDCDAPVGLTYCSNATIFPRDECPGSAFWTGADLHATALCDGDSVRLTVENVGTGNMANQLEFVVVEDLIMYMSQPYQLGSGQTTTLATPANGATWRIETPQEPGHPFGGIVAAALEGCGGVNTPGLVNAFTLNTPNPFVALDCTQSSAALDPNDKQGFPTGAGAEHFIRENTGIDYMIRFQNTGTDTAFTVVVLDTLSAHLDVASVRPGAASHEYEFAVIDGNVLRFRFNNILLPDSNVNEAASHGFIRFSIEQQPDNPDGTVIYNKAAIYFDFNAPIITNTTFHTIGEPLVTVSVDPKPGVQNLRVYPNPAGDGPVTFAFDNNLNDARFELVNQLGQTVRSQTFTGDRFQFERSTLGEGMYHFVIRENGAVVYTGTVVLR
ncbi:MAG: T9SS type A sorting domain-containing protein [Saprospiraceae bacterium]|nr:T9SS type A sorting domain-containing protein [Saprospiraceae bacterium]